MSGKKAALILLSLAVVLVGARLAFFGGSKDDASLIREALAESIKASKEGRPGGVLDKLSEKFTVNNEEPGKKNVADFVRKSKPEIVVTKPDPVVNESEGTAQINSPVHLNFNFLGQKYDAEVPNVTIRFAREDSRQWLIFPSKQWRVTEVEVPQESIPNIPGMGGGLF
jgi:hypothetical protein